MSHHFERGMRMIFEESFHQILDKRSNLKTTVDTRFTDHEARILRTCSIASSSSSLCAGLIAFYLFGAIDYKKRVFRHQLIIFLIFFDMIKAGVLLIYPSRIETKYLAYYNHNFCEIVGFFTSIAIEGADIAILSFAIHTGLLIFRPNAKVKNGNSQEGGLFKYRYYVYLISFLTPCLLASLAFIDNSGYQPLTTWCYLPQDPKWYRLVLSWVPRYCIVITIVTIYVSIYFYVMKQYRIVGGGFKNIHNVDSDDTIERSKLQSILHSLKNGYFTLRKFTDAILFPELNILPFDDVDVEGDADFDGANPSSVSKKKVYKISDLDENGNLIKTKVNSHHHHLNTTAQSKEKEDDNISPRNESQNKREDYFQNNLHRETYHQFQIRRLQIQKQMKSIFIYPISYMFLWSFPFILQCFEFKDANSSILWLNAIAAFFQPFNCTVDTMVFLYRERPWDITTAKTDTNPLEIYQYSNWRQKFSWLPLYGLPTLESNRAAYNKKLAAKQLREAEEQKLRSASNSSAYSSSPNTNNINKNDNNNNNTTGGIRAGSAGQNIQLGMGHDFSKILADDDIDFVNLSTATQQQQQNYHNNDGVDQNLTVTGSDQGKRRRSSKMSWLSSMSGNGASDDRRRSSGTTQASIGAYANNHDNTTSVASNNNNNGPNGSIFPAQYALNETTHHNKNNLPDINEQARLGSISPALEPQRSPTSPTQAAAFPDPTTTITTTTGLPPAQPQRAHSFAAKPSSLSSSSTNLFGLARRSSLFDGLHSEFIKKKNPFTDDHKATDPVVPGWTNNTFANESHHHNHHNSSGFGEHYDHREEDEDEDDDMDFMEMLRRGPPA